MKKMNNKGFSLVELIIVIAIMAVLIGVLAPQYMKYVEKSRVSADKDVLDSVYNALTIAASDPDVTSGVPATGTTSLGAITIGTVDTDFGYNVAETLAVTDFNDVAKKLKSKAGKAISGAATGINVEVDANGNFTVYLGTKNGTTDQDITVGAGAQ